MIITDGIRVEDALESLREDDGIPESALERIREKAQQILERSADPLHGQSQDDKNGLIYGLIQSGKTSVITVSAAMAVDNKYDCVLVLTSDNNELYDQTIARIKRALIGINVLGKRDSKNQESFNRQLKTSQFVIVCSKNAGTLGSLNEAFRKAKAKGLATLIIDDEGDQASLDTNVNRASAETSRINSEIGRLRKYFQISTYLAVTATPQALFLQEDTGKYRPDFTVVIEPGPGYVGGDTFFAPGSKYLVDDVPLEEFEELTTTHQTHPSGTVPKGLRRALFTFFVGATVQKIRKRGKLFAFLCHVSTSTNDHSFIADLIEKFKEDTFKTLQEGETSTSKKYKAVLSDLEEAYEELSSTDDDLPALTEVVERFIRYFGAAYVKEIHYSSQEEISLDGVYNLFVGGNKLSRGVTIENLLVTYYGRNPRRPNADTVLQHARMYGYRQKQLSVTRIYLPRRLSQHFRAIHESEKALREAVLRDETGEFIGIHLRLDHLGATRSNVVPKDNLRLYVAGVTYNPQYPLRAQKIQKETEQLDKALEKYEDAKSYTITIDQMISILKHCPADEENFPNALWNPDTISEALNQLKTLRGNKAYLVLHRDRNITKARRETQGAYSGGELELALKDYPTLFLQRQNTTGDKVAVWWPHVRVPETGRFMFSF